MPHQQSTNGPLQLIVAIFSNDQEIDPLSSQLCCNKSDELILIYIDLYLLKMTIILWRKAREVLTTDLNNSVVRVRNGHPVEFDHCGHGGYAQPHDCVQGQTPHRLVVSTQHCGRQAALYAQHACM